MIFSFVLTLTSLLQLAPNNSITNNNVYFVNRNVDEEKQLEQIFNYATNNYNFENYDLTDNEAESIIKKHLYDFNVDNNLIDDDEIKMLDHVLSSDSDFNYNPSLENKFNNTDISLSSLIDSYSMLNNKFSLNFDTTTGGGSSANQNQELLPIHSYNENNISCVINGTVFDKPFIGISVSTDTCISFYNTVSKFLNKQAMYIHDNIQGPTGMIIEIVKTVTPATFSIITMKLTSYFASLFSEFITLFSSKDPVSVVISFIIITFTTVCIAFLIAMYVCGYLKIGFASGWIIYHWYDWEFYCGKA